MREKIRENLPIWLLVQLALLTVLYGRQGWLTPNPTMSHDTPNFMGAMESNSYVGMISNEYATPAYPLLLKFSRMLTKDLGSLPYFQIFFLGLAVWFFYSGLLQICGSRTSAALIASPLLYVGFVNEIFSPATISSDGIGLSFAIMTIGQLLFLIQNKQRPRDWVLLGALFFFSYQIRPVYLFLFGVLPVLGIACLRVAVSRTDYARLRGLFFRNLVFSMLVPVFFGGFLRWMVSGTFSTSSALGYNLIGLTGQLLAEEDVPRLPEKYRRFAQNLIKFRSEQLWAGKPFHPALGENHTIYYTQVRENFNLYSWYAAPKALTLEMANSAENIRAKNNSVLVEFSWQMIKLRPREYLYCVGACLVASLGLVFSLKSFFLILGISLSGYLGLVFLRTLDVDIVLDATVFGQGGRQTETCWMVCLTFLSAHLITVALVEAPIGRYSVAAAAFFPSAMVATLLGVLRGMCASRTTAGKGLRLVHKGHEHRAA